MGGVEKAIAVIGSTQRCRREEFPDILSGSDVAISL